MLTGKARDILMTPIIPKAPNAVPETELATELNYSMTLLSIVSRMPITIIRPRVINNFEKLYPLLLATTCCDLHLRQVTALTLLVVFD